MSDQFSETDRDQERDLYREAIKDHVGQLGSCLQSAMPTMKIKVGTQEIRFMRNDGEHIFCTISFPYSLGNYKDLTSKTRHTLDSPNIHFRIHGTSSTVIKLYFSEQAELNERAELIEHWIHKLRFRDKLHGRIKESAEDIQEGEGRDAYLDKVAQSLERFLGVACSVKYSSIIVHKYCQIVFEGKDSKKSGGTFKPDYAKISLPGKKNPVHVTLQRSMSIGKVISVIVERFPDLGNLDIDNYRRDYTEVPLIEGYNKKKRPSLGGIIEKIQSLWQS